MVLVVVHGIFSCTTRPISVCFVLFLMVLMVVVVSRTSMFDEFLLWVGLEDLCSFGRFQASSNVSSKVSLVEREPKEGLHCGNQPSIGW